MAQSSQEIEQARTGGTLLPEDFSAVRELIVLAKRDVELRAARGTVASVAGFDVGPLTDLLASEGIALQPLFGVSEDRLRAQAASIAAETGEVPDLSVYYRVDAPDERLEALAERLRQTDAVEAAYVKPPAVLPQMLNDMAPLAAQPPVGTPDFTARQGYLDAAPGGIDARYAWTHPGGGGAGVRIIDIEGAWRFTHEDLLQNQGGVVGGTQSTDIGWRNHGTAVVGEFGGDRNGFGVTGICPDANVSAISIFGGLGSAPAIRQAADMLNPGDIMLIELHRPGPRFNFVLRNDQRGFIAVEWWPDDFDAIRYARSRGVIVVEAAGNGGENLDDPIYDTPAAGFPVGWTNPFNRANRDSGAIVVGAGAPPPGTHGSDHGPDRSRLDFSNWGALIDAQGWGREVTTTGYGDLQGGGNEDEWYTDRFSGTSSASPIIVGALGCAQGVMRSTGRTPLTPAGARALLRASGSPQQDAPGRPATQRIGNRPDLRQMIDQLLNVPAGGAGIDAALYSGTKCYFFAGDQYLRVTRGDIGPGTVDPGYPKNISDWNWGGFGRNGVDAALHSGTKCYFFAGDQYIRVTRGDIGPGTVDPGYPKNISEWNWGSFGRNGIDAALYSGAKCYFFAGDQYIRVTRGAIGPGTVDPGYPKNISEWNWGSFGRAGIDAALYSGTKCYFFAGDQYIRVTRGAIGPGTVDPGYPKNVADWNWPATFVLSTAHRR